jgi:predicted transposase/invertase (TIGR01784 family)
LLIILLNKYFIYQYESTPAFNLLSKEKVEAKRIEILLDMMKYIFSTRKDAERYNRKEIYESLETEYMTLLEKLEEKGELRGLEKGKIEGKIETARNLKAEGIDIAIIRKTTGLTEEQLKEAGI